MDIIGHEDGVKIKDMEEEMEQDSASIADVIQFFEHMHSQGYQLSSLPYPISHEGTYSMETAGIGAIVCTPTTHSAIFSGHNYSAVLEVNSFPGVTNPLLDTYVARWLLEFYINYTLVKL